MLLENIIFIVVVCVLLICLITAITKKENERKSVKMPVCVKKMKKFIKVISTMIVVFGGIILHCFQLIKEINQYGGNIHSLFLPLTIFGFYVMLVTFAVIFLLWIWKEDESKKIEKVEKTEE